MLILKQGYTTALWSASVFPPGWPTCSPCKVAAFPVALEGKDLKPGTAQILGGSSSQLQGSLTQKTYINQLKAAVASSTDLISSLEHKILQPEALVDNYQLLEDKTTENKKAKNALDRSKRKLAKLEKAAQEAS